VVKSLPGAVVEVRDMAMCSFVDIKYVVLPKEPNSRR
jgi:hypothetical protein